MFLLLATASSFAQDKSYQPPKGVYTEKSPRTPDEWQEVLDDNLGPWGGGVIYQFAPNTTEIWSPPTKSGGLPRLSGHLFTTTELPTYPYGQVNESWIVYQPDTTLTKELEMHYVGATPGGYLGLAMHYAQQPDATQYKVLSWDMQYAPPPSQNQVMGLPDAWPMFTDHVYEFDVYTVKDGTPTLSGALYRQHMVFMGSVLWWDNWVLFDNYVFPEDSHVVTHLVPRAPTTESLRSFLLSMPSNQKSVVNTHSSVMPL